VIISTSGKTLGNTISFSIGRFIGRDYITSKLDHSHLAVLHALHTSVITHPWRTAALIRMSLFPMFLKNYGCSCLPYTLHQFVLASFVCGIPFTLFWAMLGQSLTSVNEIAHGGSNVLKGHSIWWEVIILAIGISSVIAFIAVITKQARKEIREKQEAEQQRTRTDSYYVIQTIDTRKGSWIRLEEDHPTGFKNPEPQH
jgi:uncharacterized membrane protein YdjX (TVP38/TMEM64 family)